MPRNVSDIYFIPPGTEGFPDTTIESEKYNNYIHDVETDLNRPRPISAGGTGANDADEALANLHAEKAGQEVTNFDTHVWIAGSFFSKITTTAPPVAGHLFSGIAHITDANNMVVEAIDLTDPLHTPWTRVKTAGVWGLWTEGVTKQFVEVHAAITCADDPPTGNNASDNALWFESSTGLLYIRYNDGDSTQWTIACPQPDISTYALKTDVATDLSAVEDSIADLEAEKIAKAGDTMDGPLILPADDPTLDLQAVTKKYVDDRTVAVTVPLDALVYGGLQINGAMEVSQQYGAAPVANANGYIVDGWKVIRVGPSVIRAAQAAIINGSVVGLPYAVNLTATTAEPSLAAGSYVVLGQPIEGWRINRLGWGNSGARPITVGFWSSSSKIGTYTVAIRNSAANRSYCATYTQTAAAPQYNVITIPGCTDAVWATNNGVGMTIDFTAASGATFKAPTADAWVSGNYVAAPAQVNGIAATNDQLAITGVVILSGLQTLSAEHGAFSMRPFGEELMLCQRYFQKTYDYSTAIGTASTVPGGRSGTAGNTTSISGGFYFLSPMRSTPVVSAISYAGSGGRWSEGGSNVDTPAVVNMAGASETGFLYIASSGLTAGSFYWGHWTADARL